MMSYSFRMLLFQSIFRRGDCLLLAAHILYFSLLCFIECIGVKIGGIEEIVWISAFDLNKDNKEYHTSPERAKSFPPIKYLLSYSIFNSCC